MLHEGPKRYRWVIGDTSDVLLCIAGNAIIISVYHIDDFEMLRFKFSRLVLPSTSTFEQAQSKLQYVRTALGILLARQLWETIAVVQNKPMNKDQ